MQQHWDRTYSEKSVEQLGWYEPDPGPSLALIDRCELSEDARIIDVGAGATLLVDELLDRGYESLGVLDISAQALTVLREQLAPERAGRVRWINADITDPAVADEIGPVDLWHDRALLHFLLDEGERDRYVDALRSTVVPGGHAVIAAFAVGGAEMCNGLPVRNYDRDSCQQLVGDDFELVEWLDHTYHQPWGDPRPYLYGRFRRRN